MPEDKERERLLVEEFKAGRPEAFDGLVNLYAAKFFKVSLGLLGNPQDAEEVVQDAFVRAYRAMDSFRGDSSFETWVQRIVVNLSRNKYKWRKRRGEGLHTSLSDRGFGEPGDAQSEDLELPDSSLTPDRIAEGFEIERSIMDGLDALPDTLREAMALRHLDGMPYDSIASALGCKEGTVKSRIARGREMLKAYIEGRIGTDAPEAGRGLLASKIAMGLLICLGI